MKSAALVVLAVFVVSGVVANAVVFSCDCVNPSSLEYSVNIAYYNGELGMDYWVGMYSSSSLYQPNCRTAAEYFREFGTKTSSTTAIPVSSSLQYQTLTCVLYETNPRYLNSNSSATFCSSIVARQSFMCAPRAGAVAVQFPAVAVVAIILLVLLGLGFCVTIILCLIRRSKEQAEEKARAAKMSTNDNSLVDLSDGATSQTQGLMMPEMQGSSMMMTNPQMMQNGTSFSPYMTMPPGVYYMPNQNGSMSPVYMASPNPVMMTGQPQYYVQSNVPQ